MINSYFDSIHRRASNLFDNHSEIVAKSEIVHKLWKKKGNEKAI